MVPQPVPDQAQGAQSTRGTTADPDDDIAITSPSRRRCTFVRFSSVWRPCRTSTRGMTARSRTSATLRLTKEWASLTRTRSQR
eukprot:6908032-Prymnesium_polylepis.1